MTLQEKYNEIVALADQREFALMVAKAKHLLMEYPRSFEVWNLVAVGEKKLGKIRGAEEGFRKVIQLCPSYAAAHYNLAIVLQEQGKMSDAIGSYREAIRINESYPEAYNNMGNAFRDLGLAGEAIVCYQKAIALNPLFSHALDNLGATLREEGKLREALACHKRALQIEPESAVTYNEIGCVLLGERRLEEATVAFEKSLTLNPNYSSAYSNLGFALKIAGDYDGAICAFQKAIEIDPACREAYVNLGSVLEEMGSLNEAMFAYQKMLDLNPDDALIEAQLINLKKRICDFGVQSLLPEVIQRFEVRGLPISPFIALSWEDNPERQRKRSEIWASNHLKKIQRTSLVRKPCTSQKLRIGIFSGDFRKHPIMYCISGLLKEYDRSLLEVYAFSLLNDRSGPWQKMVAENVDMFIDASNLSDEDLIKKALSHDLDVAIDLNGYTANSRSQVFQARLAPVQVNFLGFPSTMGADCYDYIFADSIVLPKDQRDCYSERVIYMPDSYFPIAHSALQQSEKTLRSDHDLPEGAFVFCCFNNSYKISSVEFGIWMRLLLKVKGSVLWLQDSNELAKSNLKQEAINYGVDPSRLIFAKKIDFQQHLERYRHADIFLDTFNYNAHTTACDALWGGVPLVAKAGRQFSSRVSASILTAIGLTELIVDTEVQYENLVLQLANNPERLFSLRKKLAENRQTAPLFCIERYTRNFEQGLKMAFHRYLDGLKPDDILLN